MAEENGHDASQSRPRFSSISRSCISHKIVQSLIAGAGSGAVTALTTCPLDVVKVRLQVQARTSGGQNPVRYVGTIGTIRTILREERIRGLYRGLGTLLLALVPNWMIYFASYSKSKELWYKTGLFNKGSVPLHVLSAVSSGVITDLCTNPLWTIKTRLQTQQMLLHSPSEWNHTDSATSGRVMPTMYRSTFDAFRTMRREEGPLSLYKGLLPQLIGNGLTLAIQFPLYEACKEKLVEHGFGRSPDRLSPIYVITCSILSRVAANVVAYPLEVCRARLQFDRSNTACGGLGQPQLLTVNTVTNATNRRQSSGAGLRSLLHMVRTILQEQGIAGLYRGFPTNVLRMAPATAVTFASYEMIRNWLSTAFPTS